MKSRIKLTPLYIVLIALFSIVMIIFIPRFVSAEAGSGGGGGSSGCKSGYTTCFGAVWRYYQTNSNSYPIKNVGNTGYTYVTGCASTGGFFAYVLVNKSFPYDPNLVRSWRIGPVDGIAGNRSMFFGGWTNYRVYSNPSDGIPVNPNPGDYSWYSVEKAFAQTKALGQNSGYEWNGSSQLGWFCYRGLDFNLVPSISGTPAFTDGDSTGTNKATLSPSVNNTGTSTSTNNIQWRVVHFNVAPGTPVPGGGDSGAAPEQFYGHSAVAIANGTGVTFPRNVTNLSVASQVIGDFPIGTRVCYALSVQPITQSNGAWRHSIPFCVTIAKSPKFQVHGGDIRVGSNFADQVVGSGSNITTSQTVKNR